MPDLDKLQGAWDVRSLEMDGRAVSPSSFPGSQLVITKNAFAAVEMGAPYQGTFTLGERKTPKTIDMHFSEGPPKGTSNLGIYKLTGGRWTICIATHGTTRPSKFATKPDTGLALQTFERAGAASKPAGKSTSEPRATTSTASAPTSSGAPTALEGEWAMVEGVFNGAPMDKSMVAWCQRVTRGDITAVLAGPQTMVKARFKIDASTSPHAIDYDNLAGSNTGKAQAGIWVIVGDTLRVCMAAPGKPRPKDFASAKGDGRSFTTWRLSKK